MISAQKSTQDKNSSSMLGNSNAVVGAMHKVIIAQRFSDASDPLTRAVAQMAGLSDLSDCIAIGKDEGAGLAESRSEVAMLASGASGSSVEVSVMVKSCSGFGTSNQSARFWAGALLGTEGLSSKAAGALRSMCGSLSAEGSSAPHSTPGQLVSHDFANAGGPLQVWLATPSVLSAIACRSLAVDADTPLGSKLLLISMRAAMPNGDDVHMLFDRAALRAYVELNSVQTTKDGRSFVKIGARDEAIELSQFLRLKRKGGDSGAREADQMQAAIAPPEMLRMLAAGVLQGSLMREEPTSESRSLAELARGDRAAKPLVDAQAPLAKLAAKAAKELVYA